MGADAGLRAIAARSVSRQRRRAACSARRSRRARMGHDDADARIAQHGGEPLGRVVGIERQVGAARLEDAEEPDDHLGRALQAQPHHHLRVDAQAAQVMRQLVGARVELRVGEALIPEDHGGRRGRPRHLRGKQLRHGGERHRPRCVVPRPQNRLALVRRQDVEAADRLLRLRCHRLQQPHHTASQRIDRGAVEQVVAIGESQLQRLARHRHEGQRKVGSIMPAHLAHLQAGCVADRLQRSTG